MGVKPIETIYDGYRFRSRLEARWAVFFKTLGVAYEYEPEGFDMNGLRYLPDFKVKCYGTRGGFLPSESSGLCSTCTNNPQPGDMFGYDFCDGIKCRIANDGSNSVISCSGFILPEPFDLYIEVKGMMNERDSRKIKTFSKSFPLLIVGNIPNLSDPSDVADSTLFHSYDDMGFDCYQFNYLTVDGDYFAAYPAADKLGRFYLFGDDSNYIRPDDFNRIFDAYKAARMARFEHGETP